MYRRFTVMGSLAVLFLAGCRNEVVMAPEPAPGYVDSLRTDPAVIREADDCYIRSIDDNEIANADDLTVVHTVAFRQYEVTPGHHDLMVYYYKRHGGGAERGKDARPLAVEVAGGHTYALQSNKIVKRTFLFFSSMEWNPSVVDATSGERVDKPEEKVRVPREENYLPDDTARQRETDEPDGYIK